MKKLRGVGWCDTLWDMLQVSGDKRKGINAVERMAGGCEAPQCNL